MDVIGIEHDRDDSAVLVRRRPTAGWGVPLTAALALTAALLGFVIGRSVGEHRRALRQRHGRRSDRSMVLELQDGAYVQEPALSDQAELRDEDWKGTINVEASGDHSGTAHLKGSSS